MDRVLVSACLLGTPCRFDGRAKLDLPWLATLDAVPMGFCPEEAGGLGTPRRAAWLVGGDGEDVWAGRARVVDEDGRDRTHAFQQGAVRALAALLALGCRSAVLKQGSPSCGCGRTRVEGERAGGDGVTAALLLRVGISLEPR
ncbi:MAG: DUF523 domain-containing protein [Planctomycetota bacterium]